MKKTIFYVAIIAALTSQLEAMDNSLTNHKQFNQLKTNFLQLALIYQIATNEPLVSIDQHQQPAHVEKKSSTLLTGSKKIVSKGRSCINMYNEKRK